MEAFEMRSAMTYMVAIEDSEIVKMTDNGFESTGMYFVSLRQLPTTYEAVLKNQSVMANA